MEQTHKNGKHVMLTDDRRKEEAGDKNIIQMLTGFIFEVLGCKA